jgi:hypothetical protein
VLLHMVFDIPAPSTRVNTLQAKQTVWYELCQLYPPCCFLQVRQCTDATAKSPASSAGGFDGRGGWVQSKLLVKPTASMFSGLPSSPLPASLARTLSTRTESTRGRRALPAPSK